MHVFFGSYTQDRTEGVYRGTLDPDSGRLTVHGGVDAGANPSFLALHPGGRFLYACSERDPEGSVAAFAIDPHPDTEALVLLNHQPSGGGAACHVAVDPAGTTLVVSNYNGGNVASFPLAADGSIGPRASLIRHRGSSVDPDRQAAPHAHCTVFDPSGRFAVTADLGLDQLRVNRHDPATGALTPQDSGGASLHPGAGPRHLAFHPSGRWLYAINELDATMSVLHWDGEAGRLEHRQTLPTLPPGSDAKPSCAEVVVHPNGRYLYGSNRGHDSLVSYRIDAGDGTLTTAGFTPSGGAEPRNFNLDPSGRWLIACNQNSNRVQVFGVDPETGALTPKGDPVAVPMPVCVRFLDA